MGVTLKGCFSRVTASLSSFLYFLVRGKNCPDGKNCPGVRYSENNSATRATIHKRIGVRESLREELSHTPIRL